MRHHPGVPSATAVTSTYATVGAVSTLILAANPNRIWAEIVNDGDEEFYLSRGNAAVMNSGRRINAEGGVHSINKNDFWDGAVYGICESGDLNVTVEEGTE